MTSVILFPQAGVLKSEATKRATDEANFSKIFLVSSKILFKHNHFLKKKRVFKFKKKLDFAFFENFFFIFEKKFDFE